MGICESKKSINSIIKNEEKSEEIDKSDQTFDYQNQNQNSNTDESGTRPSKFNKSEQRISIDQEVKKDEKPELMNYEPSRSLYYSGKRSETNNITSIFSSGKSEEEIIGKGEIIKGKFNEKYFVNNSFKKEVIDHDGIMIKENQNNTLCESQKTNSISDIGFGNISEILSSKTVISLNNGIVTNDKNNNNNNSFKKISAIKGYNDQMINTKQNNNNLEPITNGKYNINGKLIQNNNNMQKNGAYPYQKNNMGNSFGGLKNSGKSSVYSLNHSNRINVSLHDSCPRIDSYLHVPKIDKPLPDIDEISENID